MNHTCFKAEEGVTWIVIRCYPKIFYLRLFEETPLVESKDEAGEYVSIRVGFTDSPTQALRNR